MDTLAGTAAGRLALARSQGTYGNLGAAGGAESHVIITAEMANHNHGSISTWPSQYPGVRTGSGGGGLHLWANSVVGGDAGIYASAIDHQHSPVGSDTAHNNVQPTLLANYIIKT
jgi:microcystin-dependent protein